MRTTLNIQDEALALGNRVSKELGDPLGEVVNEALLGTFGERAARARGKAFDLPVSGRGGLLPGVDLDDSSSLADVMDLRAGDPVGEIETAEPS